MTLLGATQLSKSYGGARALQEVDFDLQPGEIHALVGENGAGKSTLIKILGGVVIPDHGDVRLHNAPLPLGNPLAVRRLGVSIVYQELTLVPELSVAENIFLGRERGRVLLRRGEMDRASQAVLDELGVRIPISARVGTLSVAHQQTVEIARALVTETKVLILDEPSATLSALEVDRLFQVLRRLRERGLGIIYISHRLEEIFALADRVTVMRDGQQIQSAPVSNVSRTQLIRWMVGRDVSEEFPPRSQTVGRPMLEVRGLSSPSRFTDISFSVAQGEIVALAGLVGAGRTSTALSLIGAVPAQGEVHLDGHPARFQSPFDAVASGVAYVTEDRQARGLFPLMGTDANITVTHLASFARLGLLRLDDERRAAADAAQAFHVRAATLTRSVATLSGGNQQKVLLARSLLKPRKLIILDEPTRGVDVGARAEIYRLMNRLTDQGTAILMISSDLPEIVGMADRILVMREGHIAGELTRTEATAERVMALATGN